MILTRVIRVHVRCDKCKSAWVFVDDPLEASLVDVGWRVDGERHVCPRCARKVKP